MRVLYLLWSDLFSAAHQARRRCTGPAPPLLAALAISLLLVVACQEAPPAEVPGTPGAPPKETPAAAPPKEQLASSLVYGHPVIVPNLDAQGQGYPTGYISFRGVFDELTRFDAEGKLQPWLATEWKNVSPTTWELKLRPGLKFSNGEPLDAAAVKWSYDRVLDVKNALGSRTAIVTFTAVEAVDPGTVRITTRQPDPLVPARTSMIQIYPPKAFEEVGRDAFITSKAVGSGPFKIKEFVPNQRIDYEITPSWRPEPKLQSYRMNFITERSTIAAGLKSGEIDIGYDLTADLITDATRSGLKLVKIPQPNVFIVELDTINGGPVQKKEVRQAMNYAVDREAVVNKLLAGLGRLVGGQMVTKEGFGHNPAVSDYPYDVAKAKQLLSAANYAGGFKTRMPVPPLVRPWAEAFQGYMAAIGIDVELVSMEFGQWNQQNNAGPVLPLWSWIPGQGPLMDGDTAYQWWYSKLEGRSEKRITFRNDQFDTLFAQQRQEMDREKRLKLLQEMATVFHEEAPAVVMYNPVHTYTMSPKIQDFVANPDGSMNFDSLWKTR